MLYFHFQELIIPQHCRSFGPPSIHAVSRRHSSRDTTRPVHVVTRPPAVSYCVESVDAPGVATLATIATFGSGVAEVAGARVPASLPPISFTFSHCPKFTQGKVPSVVLFSHCICKNWGFPMNTSFSVSFARPLAVAALSSFILVSGAAAFPNMPTLVFPTSSASGDDTSVSRNCGGMNQACPKER